MPRKIILTPWISQPYYQFHTYIISKIKMEFTPIPILEFSFILKNPAIIGGASQNKVED